jgi:hypothetical protein
MLMLHHINRFAAFSENNVIIAHPSKSGGPWWYGLAVSSGKKGFFPNNYVQIMEESEIISAQNKGIC